MKNNNKKDGIFMVTLRELQEQDLGITDLEKQINLDQLSKEEARMSDRESRDNLVRSSQLCIKMLRLILQREQKISELHRCVKEADKETLGQFAKIRTQTRTPSRASEFESAEYLAVRLLTRNLRELRMKGRDPEERTASASLFEQLQVGRAGPGISGEFKQKLSLLLDSFESVVSGERFSRSTVPSPSSPAERSSPASGQVGEARKVIEAVLPLPIFDEFNVEARYKRIVDLERRLQMDYKNVVLMSMQVGERSSVGEVVSMIDASLSCHQSFYHLIKEIVEFKRGISAKKLAFYQTCRQGQAFLRGFDQPEFSAIDLHVLRLLHNGLIYLYNQESQKSCLDGGTKYAVMSLLVMMTQATNGLDMGEWKCLLAEFDRFELAKSEHARVAVESCGARAGKDMLDQFYQAEFKRLEQEYGQLVEESAGVPRQKPCDLHAHIVRVKAAHEAPTGTAREESASALRRNGRLAKLS